MNVFKKLAELLDSGQDHALCTVVAVQGSTPRKPGAKMVVLDDGTSEGAIFGTIGGGAIEHEVRQRAILLLRSKKTELHTVSLRNDLGMCCGGSMSIFIEVLATKPHLFCFGAGHIAQALCPWALALDFTVTVIDERQELLSSRAFLNCQHKHSMAKFDIDDLPFKDAYLVIATHDHSLDQHIAENIIDKPFKYAALVGSKRKALMTKKRMTAKKLDQQVINRLRCPAGLPIHADTPQEIALAILAEIILVKNETTEHMRHDSSSGQKLAHGARQSIIADG